MSFVYSVTGSYHHKRSSEQGPLGQILESERWQSCSNGHSVLVHPLVETLRHHRLSQTFVGLGRCPGFLQDITLDWTLITRIELSIVYLNTGSCEFHSLDLSEFLVLLHIDDLDRVWPDEARTGKHLGADWAVPANRGVPDPLVLRGCALSVCSGALSLRVH